jgi:outer membrane protein assembly factor BamB
MVGQTATFSVVASGQEVKYQWQKNGTNIPNATSTTYKTPPATTSDNGAQFGVVVTNSIGKAGSQAATLTVNVKVPSDVPTFQYDQQRTGQALNETILTLSNVVAPGFGKLAFYPTDGKVDSQPLFLENVTIPGKGAHDMLYVATEHDSVYALDAGSGTPMWTMSALATGETPSDPRGCTGAIVPEIGIAQTPVIDRTRGPHGAMYFVAMSKDSAGNYYHRLHALDLATGAELFGGPTTIRATSPGSGPGSANGQNTFDSKQYKERAAPLLLNGTLYLAWGSHCDTEPYMGWIMAYDSMTLQQSSVLNLTPNGSQGSIWAAGGLANDASGNIYTLNGNGFFDTNLTTEGFPTNGNIGNSFLKISGTGPLTVLDYFSPYNTVDLSNQDFDIGSSGPLVLPDLTDSAGKVRHLAVGAGKDTNIYIVDRDSMGKFNPNNNDAIYQQLTGALSAGTWTSAAYFNNKVYFGSFYDHIKAYAIQNGKLSSAPVAQTIPWMFNYPGETPCISANRTSNAILWAVQNSSPAILHAYDANNLGVEVYDSQLQSEDQFGDASKFMPPTVADGRVYVATTTGIVVFGLRP